MKCHTQIELTELSTANNLITFKVNSLIQFVKRFKYLVLLCFRVHILSKVNLVSKSMQSSKIDIRPQFYFWIIL